MKAGLRLAGRLLLRQHIIALLNIQGSEVDRIQEEGRREAAVGRNVGNDAAGDREEVTRAFDQQGRLDRLVRNIAQLEQPALDQFDGEHGAFGG